MVTDDVRREAVRGAKALRIFTTIMAGTLAFAFVYDVKVVMEIVLATHAVLWFMYTAHLTSDIRRHKRLVSLTDKDDE